jgi:hypothetical protein
LRAIANFKPPFTGLLRVTTDTTRSPTAGAATDRIAAISPTDFEDDFLTSGTTSHQTEKRDSFIQPGPVIAEDHITWF